MTARSLYVVGTAVPITTALVVGAALFRLAPYSLHGTAILSGGGAAQFCQALLQRYFVRRYCSAASAEGRG